jgi:hypothetical protein
VVVVDLPAFTPSATVAVAPEMPLPVVPSVTIPLRDNIVAVGVGVDSVGLGVGPVREVPPHAEPQTITASKAAKLFMLNLPP